MQIKLKDLLNFINNYTNSIIIVHPEQRYSVKSVEETDNSLRLNIGDNGFIDLDLIDDFYIDEKSGTIYLPRGFQICMNKIKLKNYLGGLNLWT